MKKYVPPAHLLPAGQTNDQSPPPNMMKNRMMGRMHYPCPIAAEVDGAQGMTP